MRTLAVIALCKGPSREEVLEPILIIQTCFSYTLISSSACWAEDIVGTLNQLSNREQEVASEADASCKLDLAWTKITAKLPKTTARLLTRSVEYSRVVYCVEGWMVEEVIKLAPQLDTHSLLEDDVLEQRYIPIVGTRSAEYNFTRVTDKV